MWFTSDLHFGHYNVIEYDKRPFKNIDEMHETLIANWNKVVKKKQRVYVLGDFSFLNIEKTKLLLSRLNGVKILIRGNHDRPASKMIKCGFSEVLENEQLKLADNITVNLSHFPYHPLAPRSVILPRPPYTQDMRYLHKRMVDDGNWLLHGHIHTGWKVKEKMINVGTMQWGYKPVGINEILNIIRAGVKNE